MSQFALLRGGPLRSPQAVRLNADGPSLILTSGDGSVENVKWRWLFRLPDEGTTHRFARFGIRDWELRLTSGADRELLAHVGRRRFARLLGPLHRLESAKILITLMALLITAYQYVPATAIAAMVPEAAAANAVGGFVDSRAAMRCSHAGGTQAFRKMAERLDPALGRRIDIAALNDGRGIWMTSAPGNYIIMSHDTSSAIEPDAIAALLAHEMAHLKHGDVVPAMVRGEGNAGIFLALLQGKDRTEVNLRFSGSEERTADFAAIAMLRRAGVPLKPAADMFEQMRISKAKGEFFGIDQREMHFGVADRARVWRDAALEDPPNLKPILTGQDADDLFNMCWAGRLTPTKAMR